MSTATATIPRIEAARDDTRDNEARLFLNWLVCWVLLPNLPFLPISLMGGPPRYADIVLCGVVGLVARRFGYWLRAGTFLALIAYLVLNFIARMFNMAITMIFSVIGLVTDIQPAASGEYVLGAGLLAVMILAALVLLRKRTDFGKPKWLLAAIGCVLAIAGADYALSRGTMGAYSRLAPAGAPFSSATTQTDFLTLADGKRHVMIVVVEAMGEPLSPDLRDKLDAIWMRPELADRYEISRGETQFYGSTTSGEMRELCQRWGNYDEITGPDQTCLPAILAKRGYETSAWHAFLPSFFERDRWYPQIGFETLVFGEEMLAKGASFCPNVFPGACDRDVPGLIADRLTGAQNPQFIYWLTLNSHLPVIENAELGTRDCKGLGAETDGDFPMICRMFTLWESAASALAKAVTRPDFPPTDILIVGDHMPPFTHQKSRLKFDAEHVPWILMRYRGEEEVRATP